MYDILIRKGRVIDGSGNPWFEADVGVEKERITAIGSLASAPADTIIDARHMVVCPGFVDMHSHSDFTLLVNPLAESKIRQGVTTEVIGNCGLSAAPLPNLLKENILKTMPMLKEAKLELTWSTMGEYISLMRMKGVALNVVPLVGNSNIRVSLLGFENRLPTRDELQEMRRVLAKAMEDGAFGMSTGLIYPPSCYADIDEIVQLAKVVAQFGGIYASHIRGEGFTLIDAVKEAIEIGERAGVPVEISHHKASGKTNWGKVKQTLQMMEEARRRGVDVTCDVYPYTAGSTGLDSLLPPTAYEGGVEKLIKRLSVPKTRKKIREEMIRASEKGGPDALGRPEWDVIMISYCKGHPDLEGRTIKDLSEEKDIDPFEFVFDLLIEEKASVGIVLFTMCDEDMRYVLSHHLSMVGSDSSTRAPYGVLSKGKPHPRTYGTFPRILRRYVQEEGALTLENAIRKMTSLPAQKLKLKDRGLIRRNMLADIVVMDPKQVIDQATYQEPHQYPKGFDYVLVNGRLVIECRAHTKALPGQVLRLS
ncbi:MAG: D-aminoacylase [Candidatus Bathyarchaeota archaeon]|nr:MAG: D-aminoacylase [Candidatus Bathyarchaeota archaeon]